MNTKLQVSNRMLQIYEWLGDRRGVMVEMMLQAEITTIGMCNITARAAVFCLWLASTSLRSATQATLPNFSLTCASAEANKCERIYGYCMHTRYKSVDGYGWQMHNE